MDDPKANAASEPPPDHIDSLLTEIKTEIVRYLRLARDKKALSLTSKSWAWITLPLLWETLRSGFAFRENRNIHDLVQSDSNIAKHVRKIQIPGTNGPRDWNQEDALPALLAVLAPNQVRSFTSMVRQQLQSLTMLQHFQRVENLELSGQCWNMITRNPHTRSRLPNLRRLVIEVQSYSRRSDHAFLVDVKFLVASCPNLANLEIRGDTSWGIPWICLSQELDDSKAIVLLKLSHLIFNNTYLDTSPLYPKMFSQYINVLRLHKLVFCKIDDATKALKALTRVFKTGNAQLQKFRLIDDMGIGYELPVSAIQDFLMSFSGLRQLHIQAEFLGRLSASSIANHRCLQDLCIVDADFRRSAPERVMTASDLQSIARECPSIRYLCLSICEMTGAGGPYGTSKLQVLTEFESAMIVLAELPRLSVFRLTNPANYRKSVRNAQRAKTNYQSRFNQSLKTKKHDDDFRVLANRLMHYLREHGSNIKLLVFAPFPELPAPDVGFEDQGPYWPDYCFLRGRGTDFKGINAMSAKTLRELPSKFSEIAILEDLAERMKDDD